MRCMMPDGFFHGSQLHSRAPASLVPKCGACALFKACHSPKMKPSGEGRLGILIVGEAPGSTEDEQGEPFIGPAGKRLARTMRAVGLDLKRDCWITNSVICHPPKDATPTNDQIDWCYPNLANTIKALNPTVIVPLGAIAVKALIGNIWREDPGSISKWAGWRIPCTKPNVWICPTFHPSYCLHGK